MPRISRVPLIASAIALALLAAGVARFARREPSAPQSRPPAAVGSPDTSIKPAAASAEPKPSSPGRLPSAVGASGRPAPVPAPEEYPDAPETVEVHSRYGEPPTLRVAAGDVWLYLTEERSFVQLSAAGRRKATIALSKIIPDARWLGGMTEDSGGVWISVRTDRPLTGTRAYGACRAVSRSGPDWDGLSALIRLDAATSCPTTVMDYTDPRRGGFSREGTPILAAEIAHERGRLWVSSGGGSLCRVTIANRAIVCSDAPGSKVFYAYGSLWTIGNGSLPDSVSLYRVDPSNGRVRENYGLGAFPAAPCASGGGTVFCGDYDGGIVWIYPAEDRAGRIAFGERAGEEYAGRYCATLAWSNEMIYCGYHATSAPRDGDRPKTMLRAINPKTGRIDRELAPMSGAGTKSLVALKGALWMTLNSENALYWIAAP